VKTVEEILSLPVEELLEPEVQVRLPAEDVSAWGLSHDDARALIELGLPMVEISQFIPDAEPGREPQKFGDYFGYHLGILRRLDACLLVESGRVVGVPYDQFASFAFVNSSAAQYVESSWRYYWLQREIGDLPMTLETFETFEAFLQRIRAIDAAIGSDPIASFWPGVIESW
jgi:SUKH-4 immunity protein